MTVVAFEIDELYRGRRVPPWLRRFSEAPREALHDLLVGRAYLGHLNAAEPSTLLCDWMAGWGEDLTRHVDPALADWINRYWGTPVLPNSAESALLSAQAWRHAFDLIGRESRLSQARAALQRHFPADRAFLASMTEGRSRDTEGRAWLALALRQDERSLLDRWWWLCELPAEVPWWYGRFGIHGLRHLPEEHPGAGGGFPHHVADGLVRLAGALDRRVGEGWLDEKKAESEFLGVARRAMWACNFPDKWLPFWRRQLPDRDFEDVEERTMDGWIRRLFPAELKNADGQRSHRGPILHAEPDPSWIDRIPKILSSLGRPDEAKISAASKLLAEQQLYADATGDHHFVGRTAVNFAGRIRKRNPEQALEWARLGRRYDPDNAHAWTTEAAVLKELERLDEGARIAFEAVRRFPYNDVAHNTLAEVLRDQDRLAEAERVYRQTVEDFPDDYVAPTGLGDILVLQGRLDEAESFYHRVLDRYSTNRPAQIGLEKVARARRGETISQPVAPGHEMAAELRESSSRPYDAAPGWISDDVEILLQDAYMLRRWRRDADPAERRSEARRVLEALAASADQRADIAGEAGILGLEMGDVERALDLLRLARTRFPGSPRVTWALAWAETLVDGADARRHWRRLGHLDGQLRPLQLLGQARLRAESDASERREEALDDLGELGRWVRQTIDRAPTDPKKRAASFLVGWAEGLEERLFDGCAALRIEDVEAEEREAILDRLRTRDDDLAQHALIYLDHREPSRLSIAA